MSQNQFENIQTLDHLAGSLFLAGFFMSRLKDIPMGYSSFYLKTLSFVAFGLAYSIQTYTSTYYDKTSNHPFDFQFLFQIQAILGAIASWMLIITPSLWMFSLSLFLASNALWFTAEYWRFEHPTSYPPMPSNPKNYLHFCFFMTLGSLFFVATGLMVSLNIASLEWLLFTKILNYIVGFLALYHFLQPDPPVQVTLNQL